ncbi:MAG: ABC transporter substrate-binding protein/permease [Coriobacteriia bacterium]|nr:ABC transporter substrate-binding protein/permease [Coriobacteriia bacterium]
MRKAILRALCALLAAALVVCAQAAPALAAGSDDEALARLSGKTAGVMTGTPQEEIIRNRVGDVEVLYFNSLTDLAMALQADKIDFFTLSTVNFNFLAEQYPDLAYIDVALTNYDVGAVFPKSREGESLREQYNEYLKGLSDSGELGRLQEYWLQPRDWESVDIPETGENGVLHMATTNTMKPFSMDLNGRNAGYDIAIAAGFCEAYGYGLQIDNVDFSGMLSGIASGFYDFAAGQISYTAERAESVLFSDAYYTQKMVPLVRGSDFADGEVVRASGSGSQGAASASGQQGGEKAEGQDGSLWASIRRSLLDQDRWKSIVSGLGTTLAITFAGFALANVLGAALCAMSLCRSRAARAAARVYSGLAQGLPIVVVLMVLYYIVFAAAKLNNVLVASIAFGLVYAAYLEQLFEGGIRGVDEGQWEAGLASGLTRRQTFLGIVLPQAARASVTGYFADLISLMKGTAVVGYIAVADLTKAGDVIRSTTYEAYVPLLTVTAVYLIMTGLAIACMELVKRAVARPRRGKAGVAA